MGAAFKTLSGIVCGAMIMVSAAAGAAVEVSVDRGFNTEVSVAVPALKFIRTRLDGKPAAALVMQDACPRLVKGEPELPVISRFFMIQNEGAPAVRILEAKYETMPVDGIILPSRGPLSRAEDPSSVPYETGKSYEKDAWIPSDKELVSVGKPFLFRDVRGIRVSFHPVQYNPVKQQLRVYRRFRVRIDNTSDSATSSSRRRTAVSSVYEPLYKKMFSNFAPMAQRLPRLGENGRLVIVAADELAEAVMPLMAWKLKCGIDTHIVKLGEIGGATPEAVKAYLQGEFNTRPFTHVILVGDAQQVPTMKGVKEGADSDPCYMKLAGDDHVPDAIISRISATTAEEVAYQVAKFINYEQFPSEGEDAAWYTKLMGVASSEGTPTDFERMEELRTVLLKRFTSMDQIYDEKQASSGGGVSPFPPHMPGGPWGPWGPMFAVARDGVATTSAGANDANPAGSASGTAPAPTVSRKDRIAAGVNEGRGIINYIGHGSKERWVSSGFNVADCSAKLANGWRMPLVISVACVNGDFAKGTDCFAEAWLKAGDIENPRGAVGFMGATTNMSWVPPCVVQAEINTNYLMNDTYKTAGALMMNGVMKGLEQYGTEEKSEGLKIAEQWHWFGDGTLMVRTRTPRRIEVKTTIENTGSESAVAVKVVDADGKPVEGAQVTCYTARFEAMGTRPTGAEGTAVVTVPAESGTEGYMTVVGPNLVPLVDRKITF
ncbi:MAG TPA: C25 family cysteine peptidase [Candidatus Ozemobacteraceae bacterium]|nr:C25 family cysteine peptidase [Candidatus Ozemobacteraceae bacterium]